MQSLYVWCEGCVNLARSQADLGSRNLTLHLNSHNLSGSDRPVRRREGGRQFRLLQKSDRGDAEGEAGILLQEPPSEEQPAGRTGRSRQ